MTERNEEGGGITHKVGTPSAKAVIIESMALSETSGKMRIAAEPGSWNRLETLFRALLVLVRILDLVDNKEASKLFEQKYVIIKSQVEENHSICIPNRLEKV